MKQKPTWSSSIDSEIPVPTGLSVAIENPREELGNAINSLFHALEQGAVSVKHPGLTGFIRLILLLDYTRRNEPAIGGRAELCGRQGETINLKESPPAAPLG